jgi:hypothetical protein
MTKTASGRHSDPRAEKHTIAIFMPKTDENGRVLSNQQQREYRIQVHFNPESLDITFTNSVEKGRRNQPAQVSVTETTAKLSMELVFDTTLNGIDVRTETNKLACLMDPSQHTPRRNNNSRKIPSIVIFQWGTIWFEGYIDSYREKIDFFSSEGVPLRATVSLSMTQQQRDFKPNTSVTFNNNVTGGDVSPHNNTPVFRIGSDKSVTDVVQAGNSAAARNVAAANGIENMRLPEVNGLVMPDFQLSEAPRFDTMKSRPGADESLQAKGATASLFFNLKNPASVSGGAGLLPDMESHFNRGLRMDTEVSVGPGGLSGGGGSASISADVGVSADIEPGIRFEE